MAEVVYFVRSGDRIKIGKTRHLHTRMLALRRTFADATLLATLPGYTDVETSMHQRFAWLRLDGEWFQFSGTLREFVDEIRPATPPDVGPRGRPTTPNHRVVCEVCGRIKWVYRASTEPTPRTCSRRCNGIRNAAITLAKRVHVPAADRFFAKTCPEPNTGCLLWTGAIDKASGYGRFAPDGHEVHQAHRVAFKLRHGRWPEPCGLHRCDTRACVNADHIFEGTYLDNNRDTARKGRTGMAQRTHCPSGHPYDEQNTRRYQGRRYCRACDRTGPRKPKTHCPSGHAYAGRNLMIGKDGAKRCRACHAAYARRAKDLRSQERASARGSRATREVDA